MKGKRDRAMREGIEEDRLYLLAEAASMIKDRAKAKFDETIEIAVNLGIDPRQSDQMVRGVCALPHGSGRDVKIAVFARGEKADEAKNAGADLVGAEDIAEKIEKGDINFDRCIATPDMMPIVGRLGKILGPRGLMPNPKTGTVTQDLTAAIQSIKSGAVEFRIEKAGIIHVGIGKASFPVKNIIGNVQAIIGSLMKAKPSGTKGSYLKKITLSSTMGPGIKIDPKMIMNQSSGAPVPDQEAKD